MKVTILAQFFPPETFAAANRIHALAAALGRVADVTVIAPRPGYPDPELYRSTADPPLPPNVRLRRLPEFVPHGRSLASRALGEQRLAWQAVAVARRERPDVVIASSPGMFLGEAAAWLARRRRVPFVWDIRDVTWEYAREVTAGRRGASVAAQALARLMWSVARRADLLVAATPGIAERVRAACPRSDVLVLPNTIDREMLERLDPAPRPDGARPTVTYAGLLGEAQRLGVLVEVAARLPGVTFELVGDGPQRASIAAAAVARGVHNLHLRGYLPPDGLARAYRASDVLFAQLHRSELNARTGLPSKLFEYMAAGRPIVYAGDGLAAETIRRVGCGLTTEPDDPIAIGAAIAKLLRDPSGARRLGSAGRRFVEAQPSREDRMAELLPELDRLVSRRAAA
jgi:glycosyltransferase involved in cell wall biosynthesis